MVPTKKQLQIQFVSMFVVCVLLVALFMIFTGMPPVFYLFIAALLLVPTVFFAVRLCICVHYVKHCDTVKGRFYGLTHKQVITGRAIDVFTVEYTFILDGETVYAKTLYSTPAFFIRNLSPNETVELIYIKNKNRVIVL